MKRNKANMIRILVVEDNAVVRQIMTDMMVIQDDFVVVGAAGNGLEALDLLKDGLQADIVLSDLKMEEMDGIELTQKIAALHGDLKVIILTMHDKAVHLNRALAAGASGFLLKNGDMEELYGAIRKVNAGEVVVGADATD